MKHATGSNCVRNAKISFFIDVLSKKSGLYMCSVLERKNKFNCSQLRISWNDDGMNNKKPLEVPFLITTHRKIKKIYTNISSTNARLIVIFFILKWKQNCAMLHGMYFLKATKAKNEFKHYCCNFFFFCNRISLRRFDIAAKITLSHQDVINSVNKFIMIKHFW